MHRFCRGFLGLLALCVLAAGSGCGGERGPLPAETDEPGYREGQQLERQGRKSEALDAYLQVIAKRGDAAPESHLEAGLIYLEDLRDPIAAIYYFQKYLRLEPNSRQAAYVPGLIDEAKREFARTLPGRPLDSQAADLELLDKIDRLQRENDDLKAEIVALRAGVTPAPAAAAAGGGPFFSVPAAPAASGPAQSPIVPAPESPADAAAENPSPPAESPPPAEAPPSGAKAERIHTVVRGDTLYNLAQRYYGNRSKWRLILAANRDRLPSASAPLRIGMELRIP